MALFCTSRVYVLRNYGLWSVALHVRYRYCPITSLQGSLLGPNSRSFLA